MDVTRYGFLSQKALHQGLQYARSFGHQTLEVEHVSLALLRTDSLSLDSALDQRLRLVLDDYLNNARRSFGQVEIKFGIRLDRALDDAEAKAGGELVEEDLLWEALVKQSTVLRTEIADFEGGGQAAAAAAPEPESATEEDDKQGKISEKLEKVLKDYTIDLTALAERGELDPVLGRDTEVRAVLEALGRKKKNNPILLGEAGVGKTAVAEALALRIAEGQVAATMQGKRILSLDLGALVAGARFRGEFEDRVKNLLEAIRACDGEVILFIDEIHMLVGAGSAEGSADAANLLKPALARGELRCLGATTLAEYKRYIEKDPALERRFQKVRVEEPNREISLSILRGIKGRYEVHHGVQINDEALVSAVDLSTRYLSNRRLPDKAIDLLDEACSRLRLRIDSLPGPMDELRAQREGLEIQVKTMGGDDTAAEELRAVQAKLKVVRADYARLEGLWERHKLLLDKLRKFEGRKQEMEGLFESSKAQGDFDFAAKLQNSEMPRIIAKVKAVRAELDEMQQQNSWLRQVVGSIEIAEVLSGWTKIPIQRLLKDESQTLLKLEERLARRVFGQKEALDLVARAIKRSRVGVNDPDRPLGVFLFLGPTGVGKTELAKALAEELFDDESRMVRLDMSEFMEPHNVARLIGSPPGYVGFGEGGQLTEAVRQTPYTIVLFDEIEKAHPRVLDLLLQAFDDGRLSDAEGRVVDFRNTLMILTSNLPLLLKAKPGTEAAEEEKRAQLAKVLRPEFVGRIDDIVEFRSLGQKNYELLMDKLLGQLNERLYRRDFKVVLGDKLRQRLLQQVVFGSFGGRALRRLFQLQVIDRVSERVLLEPDNCKGAWRLDWREKEGYFWEVDGSLDMYLPGKESA